MIEKGDAVVVISYSGDDAYRGATLRGGSQRLGAIPGGMGNALVGKSGKVTEVLEMEKGLAYGVEIESGGYYWLECDVRPSPVSFNDLVELAKELLP